MGAALHGDLSTTQFAPNAIQGEIANCLSEYALNPFSSSVLVLLRQRNIVEEKDGKIYVTLSSALNVFNVITVPFTMRR